MGYPAFARDQFAGVYGVTSKHGERFSLIVGPRMTELLTLIETSRGFQVDDFGKTEDGIATRLSVHILHEAGHAVFWNILDAPHYYEPQDGKWHRWDTIMSPVPMKDDGHDNDMIEKLKEDYGTIRKK